MRIRGFIRSMIDLALLKYIAVGIVNTLVGSAIMFGLYNWGHCSYFFSSAVNYILTSILSFFLNKYFTFRAKGNWLKQAVRFAVNIAVCYGIAYGCARPLVRWLLRGVTVRLQENIALVVGMVLFTGLNYVGQRLFAFNTTENKNKEDRKMELYDLYIDCCTKDGGVAHCRLDETGELTLEDWIRLPEPMFSVIEGDRLYTLLNQPVAGDKSSYLTWVSLTRGGKLGNEGQRQTVSGTVACHLCVFQGKVFCANYVSGSVSAVTPGMKGVLVSEHHGVGVNLPRQNAPHTHFVAPSPDGKYVLATDLGLDTIFTYDADLHEIDRATVPSGHGVRHWVADESGKWIYAVNELTGTVTAFAYEDGHLTAKNTVPTLAEGFTAPNRAAAIRYCRGRLVVSHRGEDSVAVLRVDGAQMEVVSRTSCLGKSPRDCQLFGNFAVCTNEDDDSVTVLRFEGDTLVPTEYRLSLPHPLCVVGQKVQVTEEV